MGGDDGYVQIYAAPGVEGHQHQRHVRQHVDTVAGDDAVGHRGGP